MGVEDAEPLEPSQFNPSQFNPTYVEVDIGGLGDFRSFVSQELDLNLRPGVPDITQDHLQGAAWAGHIPSQSVFEARMRYYQAQQASLNNLGHYITTAEVLIETIHRIMAAYSDREHASTLDMDTVNTIFGQAHRDLSADPVTDRENHRAGTGNPR